jgi:hypothetical protein
LKTKTQIVFAALRVPIEYINAKRIIESGEKRYGIE